LGDGTPTGPAPTDSSTVLLASSSWQPLPQIAGEAPPSIPDYEILAELGRGGMGVVYKAQHVPDERIVALKVIRKDRLLDEEAVRRFRREAQAAARASHPNIVRLFDSDHAGDTHFLVMEYVDGVTLQCLVDEQGPLPVAQACDIVRQAADALQHAQEQSLVHRDIKPSNLMLTETGVGHDESAENANLTPDPRSSTPAVKLLDLGVARLLPPRGTAGSESLSTLTQGGSVIGTADYVAPEQLEDPHGADIRADLYSLGCTFYFLLTGRVPFPGGTLISKLDKHRWETPEPVETLRAEIPPAVASVVHKLMAKQPADRYQSPAELARVLQAMARTGYRDPHAAVLLIRRLRLTRHSGAVISACFAPDGSRIASAGGDRTLVVWDATTGAPARTLPQQGQEVRATAFVGGPDRLVTASGLTLRLWDISAAQEIRRLSGHSGAVRCVGVCDGGHRLLSGSEDRSVRLWDVQSGREVLVYHRHTAGVTCVAPLGETPLVISGGRDQTLRIWDIRNGQDVGVLAPGSGAVLAVAVTPNGKHAASAHFDTVIRLWDLASRTELRRFAGHRQMVTCVAFTRDGRWLVSGSQDQTVRIWDVETAAELSCVTGYVGGINAIDISPVGRAVLIAGADGTLYVDEVAL
jgi:serine/threonine protein kinase